MIGEKELYCSVDNKCTKFYCVEGFLKFETIPELFGDHLEVDTRVMFHAKHADTRGSGNVIIRGEGTDIFIILLANDQKLSISDFWFDTELDSDNSLATMLKYLNYLKNLIM